ncbi:hypothetical protein GALL_348980 [mine drainage metagenome]|jgi:uncharacterized protein YdiU (UPF0061 family)|uniref:Protein adenylyltransferase SelO n=1 Tax=mine drainage metagenome TaxID=410659 RepID=A0A1J5QTU4_9ZZZZ
MRRMDMRRFELAGLARPRQPLRELGPEFYAELAPQGLPDPQLRLCSNDAARLLGLTPPADAAQRAEWAERFAGNRVDPDCLPLATVYAGHQFGNWAGQLGDGRAHLLGEVPAPDTTQNAGHDHWEVQLKGAGRTPFSRFGDGRAVLRSSLREFLASEAMWHLGVPSTRALCLVDSPLPVRRERLERAAVVTRLAPSFVRIGHFEHFSHSGQHEALRRLLDAWIARFEPDCARADNPALALLQRVAQRSAELVAAWQAVGFVHGVLNTDNLSMLGWTLDYGPFGFLDAFDPDYTPNTSDTSARYCWGRQPAAVHWSLYALGAALKPLIGDAQRIDDALQQFPAAFDAAWRARLRAKLGLGGNGAEHDALARDWLELLLRARADWTISFRRLHDAADGATPAPLAAQFDGCAEALQAWLVRWRALSSAPARAAMPAVNPHVVLRHHLAQHAIDAAESGDFEPAQTLHDALREPYRETAANAALAAAPPPDAPPACLSCSS